MKGMGVIMAEPGRGGKIHLQAKANRPLRTSKTIFLALYNLSLTPFPMHDLQLSREYLFYQAQMSQKLSSSPTTEACFYSESHVQTSHTPLSTLLS